MEEEKIKIIFIGKPEVGKSSIIIKYLTEKFQKEYEKTYEDHYSKKMNYKEKDWTFEIIDISGDIEEGSLQEYTKNSDGIVLVYSYTSKESFQYIKDVSEKIKPKKKSTRLEEEIVKKPYIRILANKIDEGTSQTSKNEETELMNKLKAEITRVSAKTGEGINKMDDFFEKTIDKIEDYKNKLKMKKLEIEDKKRNEYNQMLIMEDKKKKRKKSILDSFSSVSNQDDFEFKF
jgi:small GTP-binding protein